MKRFSLRLPDEVHAELVKQADSENISLNMYLVVSLTAVAAQGIVLDQIWDEHVKVTAIEVS